MHECILLYTFCPHSLVFIKCWCETLFSYICTYLMCVRVHAFFCTQWFNSSFPYIHPKQTNSWAAMTKTSSDAYKYTTVKLSIKTVLIMTVPLLVTTKNVHGCISLCKRHPYYNYLPNLTSPPTVWVLLWSTFKQKLHLENKLSTFLK